MIPVITLVTVIIGLMSLVLVAVITFCVWCKKRNVTGESFIFCFV